MWHSLPSHFFFFFLCWPKTQSILVLMEHRHGVKILMVGLYLFSEKICIVVSNFLTLQLELLKSLKSTKQPSSLVVIFSSLRFLQSPFVMLLLDFACALVFSRYFEHLSSHLLSSGTQLIFIYSKFSPFQQKHFSIFLKNADRGLVVCYIIQRLHCLLSVSCLHFVIYLSGIYYI